MNFLMYVGAWFAVSTVFALAWGSLCRFGGDPGQEPALEKHVDHEHSLTA